MRTFDHLGLTTSRRQSGERYVERTRVWVTDPAAHPYRVEWLRYEPESTVPALIRDNPHLAFRVDSIAREREGLETLIEPFPSVAGHVVGFFRADDGVILELMEY